LGNWTRRDFLAGSGVAAGALALGTAGCTSNGASAATSDDGKGKKKQPKFDRLSWKSVREQFPLAPDLLHYAPFLLASHPQMVADAIESARRDLDADPAKAIANAGSLEGNVRSLAGTYLEAEAEDIALTDSTTAGLGLVYGGLRLAPSHEVVTTVHDHYATHEALRLAAARTGATVRKIRLYDKPAQATVDSIVGKIVAAITPATRVLALTWVHSGSGVRLPMTSIAEALTVVNARRDAAAQVLLCLDGAHGVGVENRTVEQLGCDFLISGTHKWLFGPRGTGMVWGKPAAWARVSTTIPSFAPVAIEAWANGTTPSDDWPGQLATPGGYHSFEHRWALTEAFKFHLMIGKDRIERHTKLQALYLKQGLAEVRGVEVITPLDDNLSSGIVTVRPSRRDPYELVELLRGRNIVAAVTPDTPRYVRFGPSLMTNASLGDELIESVTALA
jgi:selenocysteine lyase/cysteine desulfurase